MTTESHEFWRTLLAELPSLRFSADSPYLSSSACTNEPIVIEHLFDSVQTRRLSAFAETHGITFSSLLLAVHMKVLSMQIPGRRFVTGIKVNAAEDENPLPLVFDAASQHESWSDLARHISLLEESSRQHSEDMTLDELEALCTRSPLFDTLFSFNQSLPDKPAENLQRDLEARIHALWQALLPGAEFSVDDGFFDAGGNSLLLVRLHEKLESHWPGVFSVARLFSVTTIAAQARCIQEKNEKKDRNLTHTTKDRVTKTPGHIAIVGIGVSLPGATTLEACWHDVANGIDKVSSIPEDRFKESVTMLNALERTIPEQFQEAAWLEQIFNFDPERFRLSPADAALVHPEQRLFLETALMALEDAGYGGKSLDNEKIGTFVATSQGAVWTDYALRVLPERAEQLFINNVPSNVATRLSFLHNWRGPATLVDTACSSALTAVHLACQALISGECTAALAGGARLMLIPHSSAARFTIESSTARTHAFDESADGTGSGEGSVVFLLKTLEQAKSDGDAVHALILGTAINQDGASTGMAAPNPAAQSEVITAAAAKAGVPLASISYIEAHGTGTHLGDPVEIEGINLAFSRQSSETGFALIGSGKGNYGHLDSCAGALGLLRAVLCLKNDQAPPQPFFCCANPRINFSNSPVRVSSELLSLPDRGNARRAGVSSFGLSGINVHAIIEAPPPVTHIPATMYSGWTVIGLSAATRELLLNSAASLLSLIHLRPDYPLANIAYTLNTGRDTLSERFVVWVQNREELLTALDSFLKGEKLQRAITGSAGRRQRQQSKPPVSALASDEPSARLAAESWAEGAELVWPQEQQVSRLHLSPSPLQRIRCHPDPHRESAVHPIKPIPLQVPIDTPDGIRYPLDVHDPAFWPVSEHRLGGVPTLVGMGLLPLLADTLDASSGKFLPFAIKEISWLRPLQTPSIKAGSVSLLITDPEAKEQHAILGGKTVDGTWKNFAEATLCELPSVPPPALKAEELQERRGKLIPTSVRLSEATGEVNVSNRWNCLIAKGDNGNELTAHLELPDNGFESRNLQNLHPGVLDTAVSIVLDRAGLIPASCAEVFLWLPLPKKVFVSAVRNPMADGGVTADVNLYDMESGALCISFKMMRFIVSAKNTEIQKNPIKVTVVPSFPVWVADQTASRSLSPLPALVVIGEGDFFRRVTDHPIVKKSLVASCNSTALTDTVTRAIADGIVQHVLFLPAPGEDAGIRTLVTLRSLIKNMHQPLQLLAAGSGAYLMTTKSDSFMTGPYTALVAGLVNVAACDEAMLSTRYLELEKEAPIEALLQEIESGNNHTQSPVLIDQSGRRFKRSFAPLSDFPAPAATLWPGSGCCVISGGTGGLALLLAEELASGGRVSLALLSRHPLEQSNDSDSQRRLERLEALSRKGITFRHWCVDVTDLEKLSAVLNDVRDVLGPITAVVHHAGLGESRILINETPESFTASTAAKVKGARNLDLLTRNDPIAAFILAGSLSALEYRAGTGAYAAANLFLDAFALWRLSEGRPAQCIEWCQIGEMGMASRILDGKLDEYSLTPKEVVLNWRTALASGAPQVALLYDEKTDKKTEAVASTSEQSKTLEKALAEIWAEILGYESIEFDDDFYALGGDSMSGIDIIDRIIKDLGHPVTFTDLVESGTVTMLAERLRRQAQTANSAANSRNIQLPTTAPEKSRYPLSWEQMALIQAQMAAEKSIAYNLPNILSLPPDCNADRLESALNALMARHEILRTRFHFNGIEPEMEILSEVRIQLKRICPINGITSDFCRNWVYPFDLEAAPPVRFELVEKPDGTPQALLFDIHHTLADGLSLELLTSDLGNLYAGKNLPPLALQLKDYAWWSRKGAGIEAVERAKLYWLDRFSLPLPVLDLPSDRPRPAFHTWQCGSVAFSLPKKSVEALRRYAATHSTTPFTVVLSAWAALLARYCRNEDLVISVPVDARESLGATGVPGMMVSLLPLRFSFHDNESVESFIRGVHTDLADAMRHRACPLGMLLEALAPPAAPERTLLSEVTLSYMNYAESKGGDRDDKEAFRLTGIERGDGKNDISIFMRDLPDQISVVCEYYSAMYDQERIERMGEHFSVLLDALLESHTDTKLSMLPLLTVEEESWLEGAGNAMDYQVQRRGNLFAHFAATVQQKNNSIAVCDNRERLSYSDLLYRAGGIAEYLSETGVCEGDIVALHIERSCTAVATILGINAVGACYLPLDPSYPPLRIALILADAQCRVVIADAAGRKALAEAALMEQNEAGTKADGDVPIQYVTIDAEKMALLCTPPPATNRGDDLLAYLMYTSGSTGIPKGVRIFEHSIIRLVIYDNYITFKPTDRILQVASFAFDLSTYDLWGALLNGSQLFISDRNDILDPMALAENLKRLNISVIAMPTGLFHRQAEVMPESFSTLRAVIAGGEAMSAELMRRVMKASPETAFFNGYGPTENTTFTTVHKVCHQDLKKESLPVGRPIPQTIVRVLDQNDKKVPIGIWGDIVTGGEGIADGYLNRPELTVERFFYGEDGIYYYRTGDLGRWRRDGILEFGGRKDGQIKLRGFRIEPGEIEEALLQHPSVAGAAVLFRRETGELIACLLTRNEALEATELRSWLMHRIPSYMVPARFIRLTHLPVNSNGKLDRIQLNLDANNGEIISDSNATSGGLPSGETEKMVAEVFSEIFQHPVENRNVSFLDLGGHSLIIIKAINRIAQRSGIRLTINNFFATPTVAGLASCIETGKHHDAGELRIPRAPETAFPFASHAEERLYLVNSLDATSAAYNMTFFFRAGTDFNADTLHEALLALVERHESLRTGFEERDGIIVRQIEPVEAITIGWSEDDLSRYANPSVEALRLTEKEVSQPFNLNKPPLLRVRVIRISKEQTLILIITHHIVNDGWSSRVFLRELQQSYSAAAKGSRAKFPPLPITVRDYALWQRTRDWSETASWWKNTLEGAPGRIELPCDRPLPDVPTNKGAILKKELPQETAEALKQIALHNGVSMAALGLALFSALLFRLTRQNELVIGMGVAGRDSAELEGLIGFFVNVLPIRIKLDQESEFDSLLNVVHKTLMEALEHRDYPFDCLIRDLAPKRTGNRQPLINVVFEYQRFEPVNTALIFPPAPDISVSFARSLEEVIYSKTAKHDLLLFYVDQEKHTALMIEYDTDIFDTLTIERWLSYFIQLAHHLCIENSAAAGSGSEKP